MRQKSENDKKLKSGVRNCAKTVPPKFMTEERKFTRYITTISKQCAKSKNIKNRIKSVSYQLRLVNEAWEKTIALEQYNYCL